MKYKLKIDVNIPVKKEIDAFIAILKENKLKVTNQRLLVAETLFRIHSHFTAEDIIHYFREENKSVSKATIYRILNLLVISNLIVEHDFSRGYKIYEHSYGHKHHDHLICLKCGDIIEFCNKEIEEFQEKTAKLFRFHVTHHSLNLYGYCENCQKELKFNH